MTDLLDLAQAAGLSPTWKDFRGESHDVTAETLRRVLAALGLPADSDDAARDSLERVRVQTGSPKLSTATVGAAPNVQTTGRWRLVLEDGGTREGTGALPPVHVPGYHTLQTASGDMTLAVAPESCRGVPGGRAWGLTAQLYSLRRQGDGGLGDFGALRDFVRAAARHGAQAVAISPIHAQFSADPDRFSPYAPSSRIMLNVLHAIATEGDPAMEIADLVDWPATARVRLAHFRRRYDRGEDMAAFDAFRRSAGPALEDHARFEVLHRHFFGRDQDMWHWRTWPDGYCHPSRPDVAAFAREHAVDVGFHAYLQFLADRGWAEAQQAARDAGMGIGLISDLAVGTDSGGSHGWSRQDETLIGLTVGAPPDLLNTQGQNWGITAFSPNGLLAHGFGAFIEMLRAALRHAGGVRIDHVLGLQRLWVVPEGGTGRDGCYLSFPIADLLRLTALESHRHDAVVLGEDLGTVPEGFSERLIERGVFGMRVLWFEQDKDKSFTAPRTWSAKAAAMTTTHDLPTVAGWWKGTDIGWRREIGLLPDDTAVWFEHENRERDRRQLWAAFQASGAAEGEAPPSEDPARAVDAAANHVGRSACELVLLPIEDALGREEQPNLPGTLDEHPNWRRRLPGPAASLLDTPEVASRIAGLARSRSIQ